ncbi:MAG: NUDIX domain-containing protein, partial [Ruminococcus sp.]|nr:NUDIX domain-containing protein [Ruminococcus sp.]
LMELGATVCLPNGKLFCDKCPISRACLGLAFQDVERLPIRVEKKKRRKEQYTVFLLRCDEKYAIRKRKDTGLLAGLWEYPNVSGICTAEEAITQAAAWQCQPIDFVRTVEKSIFLPISSGKWLVLRFDAVDRTSILFGKRNPKFNKTILFRPHFDNLWI